ncbi:UNVERIFIED_CONTAM: hypothetical protein GTU68_049967 [Idotea baltica]|nr:hypothetical protein [Idotea baltica]
MQSSNRTIISVGELNAEVNQLLNRGFPLLWVEGEISNLVRPSSGHLYFTLKDSKSQIRSAMFRNRNMKLRITPENGMKVLVRGRVGLYEPRGEYQFIAEHMEDAGVGQLQKQFEALKQKLSAAGLFDEKYKQEPPEYPKRIGIITSPTGAAIRDILNVLKRRSPQTPVLIYPVAVQGEASKTEIESAIRRADMDKKCDLIILARGGGSIEDLWSFNEENVAKAIYNASTPIICGVGHEIDFTIADFVADLRAPTPSAAAELATTDRDALLTETVQTRLWLEQTIKRALKQKRQDFEWLESRLLLQKPANKIQQQAQRLDEFDSRLQQVMKNNLANKQSKFQIQMAKLDAISPLKTLDRGYSITKDKQSGKLITSVSDAESNQEILIKLSDGELSARVDN